jgi:hypothetical protein
LDHTVVEAKHHDRAEFLDLDICVERSQPATRTGVGSWYLMFRPYRKPGNAHAYIPFTSFHARHTFRGWVLAELLSLRLLTHSSTVDIWQEEGEFFYHCLCSRGYQRDFLRAVFREITWGRRARMLEPKRKEQGDQFFETLGLCANTPKRTGVARSARTKESAGLEPQGLGRGDLWRHLPSESVLGPMQCAATRIDS